MKMFIKIEVIITIAIPKGAETSFVNFRHTESLWCILKKRDFGNILKELLHYTTTYWLPIVIIKLLWAYERFFFRFPPPTKKVD